VPRKVTIYNNVTEVYSMGLLLEKNLVEHVMTEEKRDCGSV
jgi:hypothetical protein